MTRPADGAARRHDADVVIVGGGVAGLYAALALPDGLDVLLVDKGGPGRSGSSPWAQGGMAVALGRDDSPDLHVTDTVAAGDGLVDVAAARVLATGAPAVTADLLRLGARFDRRPGAADPPTTADLDLAREGGHTVGRSVHTADATGAELVRVLREAARDRARRLNATGVALASDDSGRVTGLWVVEPSGEPAVVRARAVLLATGGCGGLFAATTNQDAATGDGVAMAYLAGACVRDLEFVQFHPTGLAVDGTWRFLLTEALRGAGATLHDRDGTRFMPAVHPDAELAPRHVVAGAIVARDGGRAWLDATGLGPRRLAEEFPTVLEGTRRLGFDLATDRVPVTPAAHYMVGGVRTDLDGRTSLPGLYAAGEVASPGVHGANRMAGNSLSEALVFGARSARTLAAELPARAGDCGPAPARHDPATTDRDLTRLRSRLRGAMWDGAGPVRDHAGLTDLRRQLADVAAALGTAPLEAPGSGDPRVVELRLATVTAELVRSAALLRTETRGGHARRDHPERSSAWDGIHLEHVRPA